MRIFNTSVTKEQNIEITSYVLEIQNNFITIEEISSKKRGLTYFHPHDNEFTSYELGKLEIQNHGLNMIAIKNNGERNINIKIDNYNFAFDPNRIFSKIGIQKTIKNLNNLDNCEQKCTEQCISEIQELSQFISNKLCNAKSIFALHNIKSSSNFDISTYTKNKIYDPESLNINPTKHPKSFFLVTNQKLFDYAKNGNFNAILETNKILEEDFDDGSFSVFALRNGIKYANCETEIGNAKDQSMMVDFMRHGFSL